MNKSLFSAKSKQLLTLVSLAGLTLVLSSPLKAEMATGERESMTEAVSGEIESRSPETPAVSEESPEGTATELPPAEVTEEATSATPGETEAISPETPAVSEESSEATATELPPAELLQGEISEEATSTTPETIKIMNSSEVETVPAPASGVSTEEE